MKTSLVSLLLLLFPIEFIGQSYLPFLEEGKVWTYKYYADPNDAFPEDYHVFVGGDTVVSGMACKKMIEVRQNVERCIGAFYEEGGKVWAFYPDAYGNEQPAKLLCDFSCKEGDVLTNLVANIDEQHEVKVESVETVESYGFQRRLVTLSVTPPLASGQNDVKGYWLEGIGSRLDMYSTWPVMGGATFFISCSLNGVTVADQASFGPGNVNGNTSEGYKCAPPTVAYDKGRLLFSCATEGAECVYEIKCADVGSGRGGEVALGQTYEIRVHATLDGWEDSDVAVATIGWRNGRQVMEGFSSVTMDAGDGNADVNRDGTVDVADIASVIAVMAAKTSE